MAHTLRYINSHRMELLRKKDNIDVDFTRALSGCDICHVNKNQQKAHHKKTVHKTGRPMQLSFCRPHGAHQACSKGGLCELQQVYQ